jgi:hypothetical protein
LAAVLNYKLARQKLAPEAKGSLLVICKTKSRAWLHDNFTTAARISQYAPSANLQRNHESISFQAPRPMILKTVIATPNMGKMLDCKMN